jgi:NADH:ubiquinone oxidoreductase subunit 2 (subunit N)
MSLDLSMFAPILPEILLLVLALLVLFLDLVIPRGQQQKLGWVTAAGMGLIMLLMLPFMPGETPSVFGRMIRFDWMSYILR